MAKGKRGAPLGNTNGSKGKPWADALRKAVTQYETDAIKGGQALFELAKRTIRDALEGDPKAREEIGNRLDGKPHQTIAAEVDTTVTVEVVRFGHGKKDK